MLWDEVEHDSENYQGQGLCYLPKAEADNTNQGLDNFAIMQKPKLPEGESRLTPGAFIENSA